MRQIINFIKYHNLFTIILGLVLLLTAGAFASEDVRNAVVGEEIISEAGIDNSQLLAVDLDNFNMAFQIINVSEDERNYYIDYTYITMVIVDNVWQPAQGEKTLTVSKNDLADGDLGLYATEEIGEVADRELAYLRDVQELEAEKGIQKLVSSVEYTGLRGLLLDVKNKVLSGYGPTVQLEIPSSQTGSVSDAVSQPSDIVQPTSGPETFIDNSPQPITSSVEANFSFRASKENSFFQCKINKLDWTNCSSPKTYSGLTPGDYTFQVFSTDQMGKYDPTPASFSWTVVVGEPF